MDTLWHDLRFSLRVLAARPWLVAAVVLTLATGLGASTAIFSVVYGVLLRPLPFSEPDRLLTVWQTDSAGEETREPLSPANFLDLSDRSGALTAMAAAEPYSFDLVGGGDPERIKGWLVTPGFFRVLGAGPQLGRTFLAEDATGDREHHAVVLSHGLWRRRFGADPRLIGTSITLGGEPYAVVGVMPAAFQFPPGKELWVRRDFGEEDRQVRGRANLRVVGRLAPGATVERARGELVSLADRLAEENPETMAGVGFQVLPVREFLVGEVRPTLLVLFGAVAFVLLIACVNVANLQLAQGFQRHRELASRVALGATRGRLARQLFVENALLALLGGGAGVPLAYLGVRLLHRLAPASLPRIDEIRVDGAVLAFALALSLATALLAGFAPMLRLSVPDLRAALAEGGRTGAGGGGRRLRAALVSVEVAVTFVLLIGTGLLVRSLIALLGVQLGFSPDHTAVLQVHVWSSYHTPEARAGFFARALDRLDSAPGVEAAGAGSSVPLFEGRIERPLRFAIEGRVRGASDELPSATQNTVTPGFFDALRVPLVEGRAFTAADTAESPPVAIVNRAMSRRFWPGESPVGKRISHEYYGESISRELVGVVGDVRQEGLQAEPYPEIYLPHAQDAYGSMTFVVRGAYDPLALLRTAQQEIWAIHPDLVFAQTTTLDRVVSESLTERRFRLTLFGCFAGVALVLVLIGVYGLVSYSVGQRRFEIGMRMALGAGAGSILRLVVQQEVTTILVGIGLGSVLALFLTRFLEGWLFGISPFDPVTFVAIGALVAAVALLACGIPAHRATRVPPTVALRQG